MIERRAFLRLSGGSAVSAFALAGLPGAVFASAPTDRRFVIILLRGALDGLAAMPPLAEPRYAELRGTLALKPPGQPDGCLALDRNFALHPSLAPIHPYYAKSELLLLPAVGNGYRTRSHFDGQDLMETGLSAKRGTSDGWLNRALAGLASGGRVSVQGNKAFAVGPVTPLVVRGAAPVLSWSPQRILPASDDTTMRLLDLYRHADQKLAAVIEEHARLAAIERSGDLGQSPGQNVPPPAQVRAYFAEVAGTAAKFLAQPDGPRVGALALDGWDTHSNEGIAQGRLSQLLGALDAALAAVETNMGAAWRDTVVALVTEFGRTARINGTEGTDHGTATVALLVGGALKGGRVIADWPGLKSADLYENRDLKPTTDLRAVLKGLLKDHLRADDRTLAQSVFPGSDSVKPMAGLVA